MKFFTKSKPKINSQITTDGIKFIIDYYKLNKSETYKLELLKKVIGSGYCLAILNSEVMYLDQKKDYSNVLDDLLSNFDNHNINYKKITVKRKIEKKIMGIPISINNDTYVDYIIGFIIDQNKINSMSLFNNYNLQYFIADSNITESEIFDIFERDYHSEENLKEKFKYQIFIDNYMENIIIYSRNEDSESINTILNEMNISK